MFTRFIFWPWFAGLIFLIGGVFAVRKERAAARGLLDKLIVLGPVLVAAALATFGAEHVVAVQFVMQAVPAWMPGHMFWAYFVGFALLCTAVSFVLLKHVRLSATLLGVMIFLFVLMLHIPKVVANPRDRIAWAVALRDLAFAGGAWAFAGTQGLSWLIAIGRICVAVPVIFFGVEHFLHPEFAPGVPLGKLTPGWVPLVPLWGYLTGAILLGAGIFLLLKKRARPAATGLGMWLILLTLFLYLPIMLMAAEPSAMNEGLNYVADTLLFAGTMLLLARAMPPYSGVS